LWKANPLDRKQESSGGGSAQSGYTFVRPAGMEPSIMKLEQKHTPHVTQTNFLTVSAFHSLHNRQFELILVK
jgi:hypothetical protein